ncbi:MAG: MBOAT family O-acyltransferase [Acidobacteriota bacterium]
MIFTELRFFAFFALVFVVTWGLESNRSRKLWLLAASFAFYSAWDWRFLSLILVSTLVDYGVGLALGAEPRESRRRWLLGTSLAVNLGLLATFKYAGFFVESAEELLAWLGLQTSRSSLEIVLPVGISFYTFQTLSYTIDIYRRRLEPSRSLLDVALFVAFFPQLVAGPIVRASHFLPQLANQAQWTAVRVRPLLVLFLTGFIKKACIADNVAVPVDAYFASPASYGSAAAWVAVLLFAVQIYCDFSGYSDMAIASAGLLGFHLGENFRHPYVATSPREFWQRWHISLSTWLRDYLYIPLGGNRGGAARTIRNLMLTLVLGGLWHGAAWRFLFWGFLHGLALAVHRALALHERPAAEQEPDAPRRPLQNSLGALLGLVLTQGVVALGWIFFRAPDWASALATLHAVAGHADGSGAFDPRWWLLILGFGALHALFARTEGRDLTSDVPRPVFAVAYGLAVGGAILFVQVDVQPFLYFQF